MKVESEEIYRERYSKIFHSLPIDTVEEFRTYRDGPVDFNSPTFWKDIYNNLQRFLKITGRGYSRETNRTLLNL